MIKKIVLTEKNQDIRDPVEKPLHICKHFVKVIKNVINFKFISMLIMCVHTSLKMSFEE